MNKQYLLLFIISMSGFFGALENEAVAATGSALSIEQKRELANEQKLKRQQENDRKRDLANERKRERQLANERKRALANEQKQKRQQENKQKRELANAQKRKQQQENMQRQKSVMNVQKETICHGQPPPAGWVVTEVGGPCKSFGSSVIIYARTIVRLEESISDGASLQICGNEQTPVGWITTSTNGVCGSGSIAKSRRTITKIMGLPSGSVLKVCGGDQTPPGWTTSSTGAQCGQGIRTTYFTRTIKKL